MAPDGHHVRPGKHKSGTFIEQPFALSFVLHQVSSSINILEKVKEVTEGYVSNTGKNLGTMEGQVLGALVMDEKCHCRGSSSKSQICSAE